mgnify:FL=1
MLFKLAARNVRRQIGSYLIYFITVSLTIALIFAVNNMIYSDVIDTLVDQMGDFIRPILVIISCIMCIIMAFVIGYATNFLLRRRKKEFGLYLTLGMTRDNILSIFAGETVITFLVSLVAGMLVGLGLYQGFMVIFTNFIDYVYTPGGYTFSGFGITLAMVVAIFFIAFAASLGYLRYAKIATLLHGEKTSEKKVRAPAMWIGLLVVAVALFIIASCSLIGWMRQGNFFWHIGELTLIVLALLASVFMFPLCLAKVVFWALLKRSCCSSRGAGRFTVRQLSGKLTSNGLMMGTLSLLLAVAIVGPNIFLSMTGTVNEQLDSEYTYDITASNIVDIYGSQMDKVDDVLEIIEEYADIESYVAYSCYFDGGYNNELFLVVLESDFIKLCALWGYSPPDFGGKLVRCALSEDGGFSFTPSSESGYAGTMYIPDDLFVSGNSPDEFTVAPDEWAEQLTLSYEILAVNLVSNDYDARALYAELMLFATGSTDGNNYFFNLREWHRLYDISQIGLFLLGDLYISAVFVLLSVALLALKVLSMITEDRPRYRALWRLGASEGTMARSLFVQMLVLFFLPFFAPLLLNIPLYVAVNTLAKISAMPIATASLPGQLLGLSGAVLAVFAVYFLASFLVAWRDVKSNIRVEVRD